jgi:hypothetical protein
MTRIVEVAPERLDGWLERFAAHNPDGPQYIEGMERFDHDPLALVLVRRGGYAVGLARRGALTAHKVGSRYVQSRTAAGGWSQQRFARRRGNQADALVGAVAEHVVRLVVGAGAAGLILGGDRALAGHVLEDPRLASLRDLPRRDLYDLPDPSFALLGRALERGRAVRIAIDEPG